MSKALYIYCDRWQQRYVRVFLYQIQKYNYTTADLKSTSMITDGVWATNVEIVAMSLLLKTDIYIAQKRSRNDGYDPYISVAVSRF